MKHIIRKAVTIGMVCACIFFSADVFSQWYLGGSLRSIWGNAGAKSGDYTQIRMVPEAGYTFNRWGIGFAPEINYIHWGFNQDESISYTKSLDFGLRLYSRYTLFRGITVSLFLDGEVFLSYLGNIGSPYKYLTYLYLIGIVASRDILHHYLQQTYYHHLIFSI